MSADVRREENKDCFGDGSYSYVYISVDGTRMHLVADTNNQDGVRV